MLHSTFVVADRDVRHRLLEILQPGFEARGLSRPGALSPAWACLTEGEGAGPNAQSPISLLKRTQLPAPSDGRCLSAFQSQLYGQRRMALTQQQHHPF